MRAKSDRIQRPVIALFFVMFVVGMISALPSVRVKRQVEAREPA